MKIPKAKKLSSGKWHIDMTLDGQRYYITEDTKKEAEARAALIKAEHMNGIRSTRPSKLTLTQAIDRYIEERHNVVSPETIRGYRVIQRNRFKSVMDKPVSDIKNWQRLINEETKIVSAKTVKNAWGLMTSILGMCDVRKPSVTLPQVIENEHEFLEPNQLQPFVDAVRGAKNEFEYLCGLHSLRRSEILALTKDSFRLTPKGWVIQVRGAIVSDGKKLVYKKENKNTSSRRNVPVVIPRLVELIPTHEFKPTVPETMLKRLHKICDDASLPRIGMHGLRHSFASLCYFLGIPEAECMRLGGWTDPSTMRKIYTHLAEIMQLEATSRLIAFWTCMSNGQTEMYFAAAS